MRAILTSLILATPAFAWEATVGDICTLSHDTGAATIFLTYDPSAPLYTLTVTRKDQVWAQSPWFAMRFEGRNPIEIATPRHVLSDGGSALTVTDTGFGNVLDGLEYNQAAYAFTQDGIAEFPLIDAAPQVRIFRTCAGAHLS
ncbi:excinuclease ABC subunit B [Ruegeria sp. HKCCD4332]|uniref:excinuclease ABC subunit B n=1 Tax=Ruegeria sp. HKCCD4332 TaxID=2683021 RepID=UPI0014926185|nr:excinuclease ABC subunit B [Ruegeria sp. HKCCD4332]NOD76648.1 excinuclease ABC subunit B [Ruegeria sp. HKCCD4332]